MPRTKLIVLFGALVVVCLVWVSFSDRSSASTTALASREASASEGDRLARRTPGATASISARSVDAANGVTRRGDAFFLPGAEGLEAHTDAAVDFQEEVDADSVLSEWFLGEESKEYRERREACEDLTSEADCLPTITAVGQRVSPGRAQIRYVSYEAPLESDDACRDYAACVARLMLGKEGPLAAEQDETVAIKNAHHIVHFKGSPDEYRAAVEEMIELMRRQLAENPDAEAAVRAQWQANIEELQLKLEKFEAEQAGHEL